MIRQLFLSCDIFCITFEYLFKEPPLFICNPKKMDIAYFANAEVHTVLADCTGYEEMVAAALAISHSGTETAKNFGDFGSELHQYRHMSPASQKLVIVAALEALAPPSAIEKCQRLQEMFVVVDLSLANSSIYLKLQNPNTIPIIESKSGWLTGVKGIEPESSDLDFCGFELVLSMGWTWCKATKILIDFDTLDLDEVFPELTEISYNHRTSYAGTLNHRNISTIRACSNRIALGNLPNLSTLDIYLYGRQRLDRMLNNMVANRLKFMYVAGAEGGDIVVANLPSLKLLCIEESNCSVIIRIETLPSLEAVELYSDESSQEFEGLEEYLLDNGFYRAEQAHDWDIDNMTYVERTPDRNSNNFTVCRTITKL